MGPLGQEKGPDLACLAPISSDDSEFSVGLDPDLDAVVIQRCLQLRWSLQEAPPIITDLAQRHITIG